jgi:hypothetical protein
MKNDFTYLKIEPETVRLAAFKVVLGCFFYCPPVFPLEGKYYGRQKK